mmetsp:Transcript_13547/g.40359  ORF Transcript_13547/g.40359 Transcript_13547/m.40359 type:complete len:375 (+) Transcript_13547:87-1211(+)
MHLGGTTQFGYHTGIVLQTLGQVRRAIDAYRGALDQDPTYAIAHYNLGVALQSQRRLDEAIRAYETAVAHRPAYADAFNNMGYALQSKGDYAGAIRAYEEALRLRPNFASARANLDHALRKSEGGGGKTIQFEVGLEDADDADDAGDSPRPSRTPNQKRREKRTLGRKRGNELLTVDGLFAMLMAAPIDGAKLLRTGWKNPTTLTGWSEACKGHTAESAAQLVYKFWGCGQSARDYFCDVIDRLHAAGKVVNVEAIAAEAGRPVDDGGLGDSSYAHYRRVIMGLLLVQLLERYGFSYSDVRFPNWDEFYKVALSCGRGHKRLKIGLRFLLGDAVRKDQVDLGEDVTQTVGMPFVDALRAAAEARHAATAAANND